MGMLCSLSQPFWALVSFPGVTNRTRSSISIRDISVGAGKKKKQSPGGRIEGKRTKNEDIEVPQEWIDRAIAEADVVYNDDYYKYGPYGPYRSRGLVHGEPILGDVTDPDSVFLFNTVKDEDEAEALDKDEQERIFLKKFNMMDEDVGIKLYYVFVRSWRRTKAQLPWKEWTLAANVAVESAEELDKWTVGELVELRARHAVTRCVSWCRPDLIWVKRPAYQMRYQPQEEFVAGLFQLLNPDTELKGIEGTDVEEMKKQTFYYKLCEKLGVKQTASEREILAAFDNLDDDSRSQVLEHMLFGQPVQLLHPFSQSWRRKEKEAAALGIKLNYNFRLENEEEEDEEFMDDEVSEDETDEEEDGEDEEQEKGDVESASDEVDDEDETEGELDEEEQEEEEQDYAESLGDITDVEDVVVKDEEAYTTEEFSDDEPVDESLGEETDVRAEAENKSKTWKRKDNYFGGKGNPLRRRDLETWQRDYYKAALPSSAEIRHYPKELYFHHFDHLDDSEDEEHNWIFEPETGLKAAVRPFTYREMLQEIVYIRRQYTCYN